MKFSSVFGLLSLAAWTVSAAEETVEESTTPNFSNQDFKITFEINGAPSAAGGVARLFNEDQAEIKYSFINNKEAPVTIVGVGGALKNIETLTAEYNLTDAAVGPVLVDSSNEGSFIQKIGIDMIPGAYVFAPVIYINFNDVLYVITPNHSFITIEDLPISFFDPQLLLVSIILIAGLGGISYFAVTQFVIPYVNKNYLKKNAPKPVKTTKKKVVASATTSGAKYDETWLPEGHLKKQKKKQ